MSRPLGGRFGPPLGHVDRTGAECDWQPVKTCEPKLDSDAGDRTGIFTGLTAHTAGRYSVGIITRTRNDVRSRAVTMKNG
jgi:hypothetical protein